MTDAADRKVSRRSGPLRETPVRNDWVFSPFPDQPLVLAASPIATSAAARRRSHPPRPAPPSPPSRSSVASPGEPASAAELIGKVPAAHPTRLPITTLCTAAGILTGHHAAGGPQPHGKPLTGCLAVLRDRTGPAVHGAWPIHRGGTHIDPPICAGDGSSARQPGPRQNEHSACRFAATSWWAWWLLACGGGRTM